MRDVKVEFGINAGKVWRALDSRGSLTRNQLIKQTNLKKDEFQGAVGWLAKENKIRKDGEFFTLDETNLNIKIGESAGKIWKVLNLEGENDILKISKLTKIEERDIYLAIGWLAREHKIQLNMGEQQHKIKSILSTSH